MNIFFNNVDFTSRTGPNNFGKKLGYELEALGHHVTHQLTADVPDVALSFIQGYVSGIRNVLRLDGIYFNSAQDWRAMNAPIKQSYDLADAVVVQSRFNQELVFKYFGERDNVYVIHNGTTLALIDSILPENLSTSKENTWMCASSWRPHKRLAENIRYFQQYATDDSVLLVAGKDAQIWAPDLEDSRIRLVGDLQWSEMISLMKSSGHFLHLALLDHCPNVVVDARACGCQVICAASGGTREIAGKNAIVIKDIDWDFLPFELYIPPSLNFNLTESGDNCVNEIGEVAKMYLRILEKSE